MDTIKVNLLYFVPYLRFNNAFYKHIFVCRGRTSQNAKSRPDFVQQMLLNFSITVPDFLIELLTLQYKKIITWLDNATLLCDGASCVHIITRHHPHGYSSPLTFTNSIGYLYYTQLLFLTSELFNKLINRSQNSKFS